MTAVEAKKLVLEREDDLIGHKRMIYVFDGADKTKELTRKVIVEFFKKSLGFTDDEIIFVDVKDFYDAEIRLKLSDETKKAMNKFARLIFDDVIRWSGACKSPGKIPDVNHVLIGSDSNPEIIYYVRF